MPHTDLNFHNTPLPKIFELDNYYQCRDSHKVYCKFDVQLKPTKMNDTSALWLAIEKTKIDPAYYDHSELHHGICLESSNSNLEYLMAKYRDDYNDSGLEPVSIRNMTCIGTSPTLDILDFLIMFVILLLVTTVTIATKKYGMSNPNESTKSKSKTRISNSPEKILTCFSVRKNWQIVSSINKKYAFIDGLRSITMIIIITLHGLMAYFALYTENPNFLENLMTKLWFRSYIGLVWFIVQSFFVLSAMLLTMQIMDIYNDNKRLTLKDVSILAVNRFCRLLPAHMLIIGVYSSHIPQILGDGVMKDFLEKQTNSCKNTWFLAMFFINNYFSIKNMCVIPSWYLAVDTQLYMMSILLFYVSSKTKTNVYSSVTCIAVIAIFFNIFWNYSHGYPAVISTTPKTLVMTRYLSCDIFFSLYMSTYSNIASYMIGLLLGVACFRTKNADLSIMKNKFIVFFWYVFSFGLPLSSIFLTLHEYSTFTNAVIGSIVKPMYALGCAIMIFGMMKNENVTLKKLFEWKPIVFLGNFTYSTYVYHFGPLLGKFAHFSNPIQVNGYILIGSVILDIISSYAIGICMFFLVEYPGMQLQKLFIPRVQKGMNGRKNTEPTSKFTQ